MLAACCLYLALIGWAPAASKSEMAPMGDNTYAITRTSTNGFNRNVKQLKAEAQEDAAKFCASQGKELKVLALTSDRPHIGGGYTTARIVFKALNAGDPELTRASAPMAAADNSVATGVIGDSYTDLLKLDDLHKKGILTDKEFESEKKKVLRRSK